MKQSEVQVTLDFPAQNKIIVLSLVFIEKVGKLNPKLSHKHCVQNKKQKHTHPPPNLKMREPFQD